MKRERDDGAAGAALAPRLKRTLVAALFSLVPLTALYFIFPDMDKVTWILLGMLGPLAFILMMPLYRSMLKSLLASPRYWMGVIAQFFYVGVQIAAWTWMNAYIQKELGVEKDVAAGYYLVAIIVFVAMRWITTGLMRKFEPASMMAVFALGAIGSVLGVMYLPSDVVFTAGTMPFSWNVIALVSMSGFMSLMFPTIYGIALGSLEPRAVKLGAAGLIMAILGGAIITPWMAGIIGNASSAFLALVPGADAGWDANLRLSSATIRASFAVPGICFAVVLVYALAFRAKRLR